MLKATTRVKTFFACVRTKDSFEKDINSWIATKESSEPRIRIMEFKYVAAEDGFSCMIVYEEIEKEQQP